MVTFTTWRSFVSFTCDRTLPNLAFAFLLFLNWIALYSSGMNSAAWYVNSSKKLALRHFTHWHLLYFYFDLELDGHMQLLHELPARELFQEACSQTLHSHASCLNYSIHGSWSLHWSSFRNPPCVATFKIKGGCGGSPRLYLEGFTRQKEENLIFLILVETQCTYPITRFPGWRILTASSSSNMWTARLPAIVG